MSIFYFSSYEINHNDKNRINAIAKYNKKAYITEIDGIENKSLDDCDQLPQLITNSKKEKMTIICKSTNSNSTREVFPIIDVKEIQTLIDKFHHPAIDEVEANASELTKKIGDILRSDYQNTNPEFRSLRNTDWKFEINKLQALIVIKNLQATPNVLGAIHLQDLNKIVFQFDTNTRFGVQNFVLDYSTSNPGFRPMHHFGLDLDDGFYVKEDKTPSPLMNALNVAFIEWKKNHFEGALFKSFTAPSLKQNVDKKLSSNSLFNAEPTTTPADDKGPSVKQGIRL